MIMQCIDDQDESIRLRALDLVHTSQITMRENV